MTMMPPPEPREPRPLSERVQRQPPVRLSRDRDPYDPPPRGAPGPPPPGSAGTGRPARDAEYWRARAETAERDFLPVVRHHIEAERAGERLAQAVRTLIDSFVPEQVSKSRLAVAVVEALENWDAHQWPDSAG